TRFDCDWSSTCALPIFLGIPLVPMERLDPQNFDLVALIDTQPAAGNNSLPPGLHVDILIDHHPPRGDLPHDIPWVDVRPTLGARSEERRVGKECRSRTE